MLVCLNPSAGFGRSARRWARLRHEMANLDALVVEETGPSLPRAVREHVERGERFVVAAGGDGTVHQVVNCLMDLPADARRRLWFGALALGSSNDFHKPNATRRRLAGVPVRVDREAAISHNLVRCSWQDRRGGHTEHFIANASLGLVADANHTYNQNRGLVAAIKRLSINGAITYCALRTLFRSSNRKLRLTVDGVASERVLANVGVLLNHHFGGGLRYDTPVDADGPRMCVQLCEDMGRWRKLVTFSALSRGRFSGLPGTRTLWCESLRIEADEPFAFEMDGEVRVMSELDVQLVKGALRVCR